jgi:polyferredoxin
VSASENLVFINRRFRFIRIFFRLTPTCSCEATSSHPRKGGEKQKGKRRKKMDSPARKRRRTMLVGLIGAVTAILLAATSIQSLPPIPPSFFFDASDLLTSTVSLNAAVLATTTIQPTHDLNLNHVSGIPTEA